MFRSCVALLCAAAAVTAGVCGACPSEVLISMHLAIEYAVWRGWHQALIFDEFIQEECRPHSLVRLSKCLSVNGVGSASAGWSAEGNGGVVLERALRVGTRLGLLHFAPPFPPSRPNRTEQFLTLLNKLFELDANTESYDWLVIAQSADDLRQMQDVLRRLPLRFDQHLVLVYPARLSVLPHLALNVLCGENFIEDKQPTKNNNGRGFYSRMADCSVGYGRRTSNNCSRNYQRRRYETDYYKTTKRFGGLAGNSVYRTTGRDLPLRNSGILSYNYSRTFDMKNSSELNLREGLKLRQPQYREYSPRRRSYMLHLVQYFKVRSNSTLYAHRLGTWSDKESMSKVSPPYPVEARSFLGEELTVGRCNSTGAAPGAATGARAGEGAAETREGGGADDEAAADSALMDDVTHFICLRINATPAVRYFSMLGFRSYEGSWSGLLGALVERSVDVAMEPVTEQAARHTHMDFIFPIAETIPPEGKSTADEIKFLKSIYCVDKFSVDFHPEHSDQEEKNVMIKNKNMKKHKFIILFIFARNIYIRQQETSTVRDIFLAPFSPRLIVCVVAMTVALAAAMVVVSRLLRSVTAAPPAADYRRQMGCVEAFIWTTGIMCQQGGAWMPHSSAARVLLVSCLLFGLVIYNSYAAFITSVLSVRVASLDTVSAVLHSPYFKIGYVQNGADQMYLMSTKDEDLNKFYIRGYSDSKNLVSNAEEGLARAAKQDYAFFASQRVARGTLRALSQARGRCSVRELPVPSTLARVAFPLPRRSPYAKPLLLSLVTLRGGGVLARLGAALVPRMPQCAPPPGFASARPADVQSALLLLALGAAASAALGISEYCWMNRRRLRAFLQTCILNRLVTLFQ